MNYFFELPIFLDSSFWESVSELLLSIFIAAYMEWGLIHLFAGSMFLWNGSRGNGYVGEIMNGLYEESEIDFTSVGYPPDTNRVMI